MNALSAADAASRPAEEVLRSLETSAEEVKTRLEEVGPNVLDRASGEGALRILLGR